MTEAERIQLNRDMEAGRSVGRLDALEGRIGRHEDWTGSKLEQIDKKLDDVLGQLHSWQGMQRLVLWASGPVMAVVGWIAHTLWPWSGK